MGWIDASLLKVSPEQKEQIEIIGSGPISLLTGGPGTGKTRVTTEIYRSFKGLKQVVAPTGKAASRVREVNPDIYATTIHSALEPAFGGGNDSQWSFARHKTNPLDSDLLICDETSMLSADLFESLLMAIKNGTKLLLVGDPYQLSPVGAGRPFLDLIDAGLPHGHLSKVWRFSGRVAEVCRDIKNGVPWTPSPKLDLGIKDFPENFIHVEASSMKVPQILKSFVSQFLEKGYDLSEIQVITPCNTSGELSRSNINRLMQKWFNQDGEVLIAGTNSKDEFRAGDKVMWLENQRIPMMGQNAHDKSVKAAYVANGDTGIVLGKIDVGPKKTDIIFKMPGGVCRIDSGKFRDNATLCYAITGHKSQGSQYKVIIPIADDSSGAKMVADRSYYYTVFSRMSEACVSLGSKQAIASACRTVRIEHRKTFLTSTVKKFWETIAKSA